MKSLKGAYAWEWAKFWLPTFARMLALAAANIAVCVLLYLYPEAFVRTWAGFGAGVFLAMLLYLFARHARDESGARSWSEYFEKARRGFEE